MTDEDEQFQQIWGFRRNDNDLDSSSDDQSRPISVAVTKLTKNDQATHPAEVDQQTVHSPLRLPRGLNNLSYEEPNKEPTKSRKKRERKAKSSKAIIKDPEPSDAVALNDLRGYMQSLVDGVKIAREDLLKWMNDEMLKSSKDEGITKPTAVRKGQRRGSKETQDKTRSKTPRNTPNKARKRTGTTSQNREDRSLEKSAKDSKTSHEVSEVVVPEKEPAEETGIVTATDNNQKPKGKRSRPSSAKKQKVAANDQQTDKEPASVSVNATAVASDYLTLPTVLPRQEAESSDRTNSEVGDDRGISKRTALTQATNLSSQLNFTPTSHQNDGVSAQNGLRNASDYEQNIPQATGNILGAGSGYSFPFGLSSQGLNNGYRMSNFPTQFGLQYISQESMLSGLRTNGGHPVSPVMHSANHAFMENYGAYNQQFRFRAQDGVMPLLPPVDIRTRNLQPR